MGYLNTSASTQAGMFGGSSYTNYEHFTSMAMQWKNHKEIKSWKVSDDGLKVEAEWKNGDKRWANYAPHAGEAYDKMSRE